MTTGFIVCGALGREVLDIIQTHGWDAEVVGVSATNHMFPERIAPDVEKRIRTLRERYVRLIVVFGGCGSRGALDEILERYGVERTAGPHCYEMYGGSDFHTMMVEEPGTFFLTDFLVRSFRGTILKGLGLDRHFDLRDDYFRNYRRIVYLAQTNSHQLKEQAGEIAEMLELPLEIRYTGYGQLEQRLISLMGE